MANRAPIPVTTARLLGARSIPTSELTFKARVTSRGARNSRLMLMNANVSSEMKPHPIRCAAAGSRSSPASAAVSGMALSQGGLRPRRCYGSVGARSRVLMARRSSMAL